MNYIAGVPTTRWGEAINRLLAERGWTKRQLAQAASIRANTLTNIIRHGRDADLATLGRLARALDVDIAELFLSREQSVVLHAHKQSNVNRLRDLVVREVADTVSAIVAKELERLEHPEGAGAQSRRDYRPLRRTQRAMSPGKVKKS